MANATPRPRMAFWVHQAIEELVGVLLIMQALTLSEPVLPVVAGVVLVVLGATADGPLSLARWVPRSVHRVLDVLVAVALVVAAVVFRRQGVLAGWVLVLAAGLAMAVLVWRTDYRPRVRKAATATAADEGPATPSKGEVYGKAAGRAVGKGFNVFRGRDPGS